jgi:hypothetical protein
MPVFRFTTSTTSLLYLILVLLVVWIVFLLPLLLSRNVATTLQYNNPGSAARREVVFVSNSNTNDAKSNNNSSNQRHYMRRQRMTLPPRNSSACTAGFVHIGKTGGSTLSTLLKNGCNSIAESSSLCQRNHTETSESSVSKLVVRCGCDQYRNSRDDFHQKKGNFLRLLPPT